MFNKAQAGVFYSTSLNRTPRLFLQYTFNQFHSLLSVALGRVATISFV